MNKEIWKRIEPNWEINSSGIVRNYRTGHIIKIRHRRDGYLDVKLNYKRFLVHRLVAIHFILNPDNLPQVNHLDGRRDNPDVSNLEWVDQFQNMKHAVKTGLFPDRKGIKNGRCKISEETARLIKKDLIKGLRPCTIRDKYKVTSGTVFGIKRGIAWRHI